MESKSEEVLELFEKTGALHKGHFVLRSGMHSGHFFQCAQVCQNMGAVTRLAELTIEKLSSLEYETVVAPAMGGLVIGQEIARQAGKRYIFLEKLDGNLALRRGFKIRKGEKVIIIDKGKVLESGEVSKITKKTKTKNIREAFNKLVKI